MRRISLIMTIVAALTVTFLIPTRSQTPSSITRTPQVTTRLTNEQQLTLQKTVTMDIKVFGGHARRYRKTETLKGPER